jgi:hypothetical protein
MPLPLANLDDRRWADLVEEGRTLLPLFTRIEPRWTDHNIHDPGITLLELFAWLTEMDVFRLSRIPDRHRRKFLALIGFRPHPPQAARTILTFQLKDGSDPVPLPAGLEFETPPLPGIDPRFRTLSDLTVVPLALNTILVDDGTGLRDRTRDFREGLPLSIFGEDPQSAPERGRPALYLGFSEPLTADVPLSFYLRFAGPGTSAEERERILQEYRQAREACDRPQPGSCAEKMDQNDESLQDEEFSQPAAKTLVPDSDMDEPYGDGLSTHHSAHVVWEIFASHADPGPEEGDWVPIEDIQDSTRSLTLDGTVRIRRPNDLHAKESRQGPVREELYYLRCRLVSGQYDVAPRLLNLLPNSVTAEQAIPVGRWELTIAAGLQPDGQAPLPGKSTRVRLHLSEDNTITSLSFQEGASDLPEITVLEYMQPAPDRAGKLVLELEVLGLGQGRPHQALNVSETKVQDRSLRLLTLEKKNGTSDETIWRTWTLRDDLDSSTRTDAHFTLDSDTGEITSGSGERGRLFPPGAIVLAAYRATVANSGNLAPGKVTTLSMTAHNKALLGENLKGLRDSLKQITNPLAATGGAGTESLDHTTGRAMEILWAHERLTDLCERFDCQSLDQIPRPEIFAVQAPQRAVGLIDYERLAFDVPGIQLARARAWANLHPVYPCLKAPGVITMVIMPSLPVRQPQPSRGLLDAVRQYLNRRRILTTRVEVVGPTYLEVRIRAKVQAISGASAARVREDILQALNRFLSPQSGNGDQPGWPFGRDVYRAEVLQVIDGVSGVDYVNSLELLPGEGEPQCGNLRVCPTWLVVPGDHEIEVLRG